MLLCSVSKNTILVHTNALLSSISNLKTWAGLGSQPKYVVATEPEPPCYFPVNFGDTEK